MKWCSVLASVAQDNTAAIIIVDIHLLMPADVI